MSAPVHALHTVEIRGDMLDAPMSMYDPYATRLLAGKGRDAATSWHSDDPMSIQAGNGLLFLCRVEPGDIAVLGPEEHHIAIPRSFCGDLAVAQTITLADSRTPTLFEALDLDMQPADPSVQLVLGAAAAKRVLVVREPLLPLHAGYRFIPNKLYG